MRIFITEDEGLIRMDLREMLEEAGHEIIGEATNGQEALNMLDALAPDVPDLMFLDISMPVLDGLETAEQLAAKNDGPLFPIVMLTAYSGVEQIERARDAGVFGYLIKPFSTQDIVPTLEIAVARFKQEQTLRSEKLSLTDQLETRKLLDRAKGILMKRGLSEQEAFTSMQKFAMDKRKSLRQIAEAVITSEELSQKE